MTHPGAGPAGPGGPARRAGAGAGLNRADLLKLDAAANQTPAELQKDNPQLLTDLHAAAADRTKAAIADHFADSSKDLKDAVAAVDVAPREGGDVKTDLIDALEAHGVKGEVLDEAKSKVATLVPPADPVAALPADVPLAANPDLQGDLQLARLHRIATIAALPEAKTNAVAAKGLTETTLDDATVGALVATGALAEADAKTLGATVGLYRFLDGDPALTEQIQKTQVDAVPGGKITQPLDLVHLDEDDWVKVLSADGVEIPAGLTREQYATLMTARVEAAFPTDALVARFQPRDTLTKPIAPALDQLKPLFDKGKVFTAESDVTAEAAPVQQAFEQAKSFVDRYPGLGLEEILDDTSISTQERVKRATDRVQLVSKFSDTNKDVELLGLDLSAGSPDLQTLDFKGIAKADQPRVLANVKAYQRLYSITRDLHDVERIASAGYHSATAIVADGVDRFTERTKLDAGLARTYFDEALSAMATTSSAAATIADALRGGFTGLKVANLSPSIEDYFRHIDGWEDLFGSQDYCRCEHCSSILSPAAYFVDLMSFIESNITSKVFTGNLARHVLNLQVRRPDLWTLPLTCENTDTEIPLLVIVDEILENYIAKRHGFGGDLSDRAAVWRGVYRDHLKDAVDSLGQPFMLPLERLEAYLTHFGRTRGEIAAAVGKGPDDIAAATLGFSAKEQQLVTTANATTAFLRQVFAVDFQIAGNGNVSPFDAHDLVNAMGVTRDQLGDLLGSKFVQADGAEAIQIRGEKRSADSVQNDVERIHGLRASSLDRLHRFTRLWRASGLTIRELDLTLSHLKSANLAPTIDPSALRRLVQVQALAKRFRIDAERATVLYDVLSTTTLVDGKPSLFDRTFNLDDFVSLDGTYPKPGTKFVHPALRDDPAAPAPDHALQRLLGGLRVTADQLYQLVVGLATPLGIDIHAAAEADRGFALSLPNLSLLYRHARLAESLKVPVPRLFRLAGLAPGVAGGHVGTIDDLQALVDFTDWLTRAKLDLDDLAYVIGQPVESPQRYRTPADVARRVIDRAAADKATTFGDAIFAHLPGVSEAGSRAILAANAAAVVLEPTGSYRLADNFDPTHALTIPAGVAADEPSARALLVARHPTKVIPTYLASELGVDVPKATSLAALSGINLSDPALAQILRGENVPTAPLEHVAEVVLRLSVLLQGRAFDAASVDFVAAHKPLFVLNDVTAPTLDTVKKVSVYRRLATDDQMRADLRAVLGAFDPGTKFAPADQAALARILGVTTAVSGSLQSHLTLPATAPEALELLLRNAEIATYIGVDGAALGLIADTDYDKLDAAADAVLAAFRAKYPDEKEWEDKIGPFEARILDRRRDGLCDYLVYSIKPEFESRADLYRYFLVDVEVDGCFLTSRIVAAISSLQLYVQRVLMSLEQDEAGNVHVLPSQVPLDEWAWRQHYRVFEANRKVFLWPENYLFPDLRDDKTPLFEELENDLLQKEIDEQAVLDAYGKYLEGFQEISRLRIAGSYHDVNEEKQTDHLHLIGVTAGDPPSYYYRRVDNARYGEVVDSKGVVWGPWRAMDVKIPVRRVAPVVYNGRLHVFWLEITTIPQNEVADQGSRFVGYAHKLSLKYSTLRLDDRWTPPQRVSLYHTRPFIESDGIVDDPLAEPEEWEDFRKAILSMFGFGIFGSPDAGVSLPEATRKLITPRYDDQPHTKARDGYTLHGMEWEQVYPEAGPQLYIAGVDYQLRATVDLFDKVTYTRASSVSKRIAWTINKTPPSPVLGVKGTTLFYGTPSSAWFDDYAYAALVADSARLARVLKDWSDSTRNSISAGVYSRAIATLSGELAPVNGSLSDGILDLSGDLYLLQASVRDGARWLLKRLGTTLAPTVSRALFTHGVDGLLDYDTQKQLAEAPRKIGLVGNAIEDDVVTGKMDFTGSYGVYFREIFFHIPFLIAQALNGQAKFAEAQKWYQYVFNPTASEVIPDDPKLSAAANAARKRDRNWRYVEFRGLDLPTLRKVLTDAKAIEAYKTDPFNPHAIARLRLSAYQKAIVMRYIDNLLDWADELFTQFQMETVNQAMVLYATAADILGERPAQLGECGEAAVQPKTYERIKPFLAKGSEFLIELEHWTFVKNGRRYLGKQRARPKYLVDGVKAVSATDAALASKRLRDAGVASSAWKVRVESAAPPPKPDDAASDAKLIEARLAAPSGLFGSATEVDAAVFARVLDGAPAAGAAAGAAAAAAGAAPAAAGAAAEALAGVGVSVLPAKVVSIADDRDRVQPFVESATQTVDWKNLSIGTKETRYLPARDHRLKDIVRKDPRLFPHFGWGLVRQVSPAFCIPPNKDLLDYWTRLEDRLFKIRNCMDITGARRQLSLFAPEIDPMMLVRARAAGLSLDDVLDALAGEHPPYRFVYLVEKAKQFCASVQSFGNSLLSALERKDTEELNQLRVVHQQQLLTLTTSVRQWEFDSAAAAVEALLRRKDAAEHRRAYYALLISSGLSTEEWTQRISRHIATSLRGVEATLGFLSGALHLIPQLGSPFAMKYGGMETGSAAHRFAVGTRALADLADVVSASAALESGFSRREQGWKQQLEAAQDELAELDQQIRGAELRRDIAERGIELHSKTLDQTNEIYEFYSDRFTNVGLYSWLSTELQRIYREAYNAAYAAARMAERAFRFERDEETATFLQGSYWDAGHAGLLAGAKLQNDLLSMERRFIETNYRKLEIDQSFSLSQIAPAALANLKETGECDFTLAEIFFDLAYPGHYRRRIRAVRLTIPSVTGPFANVSATLSLTSSHVRKAPALGDDQVVEVPVSRPSSIATSNAQNDAGVFELSFRDERYMPFEGMGAIASFRLELPKSFRPFDYETINDVIVRVSYTAEADGAFAQQIQALNAATEGTLLNFLSNNPLPRAFSLRHEFSNAFNRLLHSPLDTAVKIAIEEKHMPFFLHGRDLTVTKAVLAVRPREGQAVGALDISIDGTQFAGFAPDASLGNLPAVDLGALFANGLYRERELKVHAVGDLAPDAPVPGDPSALDEDKLLDVILYLEYQLA